MRKDDKDYLDAKLDQMFVKWGLEFYKLNSIMDVMNVTIDDIIKPKLDNIEQHVEKTNGRVTALEQDKSNHDFLDKAKSKTFGRAALIVGISGTVITLLIKLL